MRLPNINSNNAKYNITALWLFKKNPYLRARFRLIAPNPIGAAVRESGRFFVLRGAADGISIDIGQKEMPRYGQGCLNAKHS